MTAPMPPQGPLPGGPSLPPPPKPPWTPFQARPNDNEMGIASLWARKLSAVISSVKYASFPPEWREPLDAKYLQAVQAATPPMPVEGQPGAPKPKQGQQEPPPQGQPQKIGP